MSIEQISPEEYYGVDAGQPAVEAAPPPAPAVTLNMPPTPQAVGVSDQMLLGFMVFGSVICVLTVFGFALMYRSS